MIRLLEVLVLLVIALGASTVLAIKCYNCDNVRTTSCGQPFRAYYFEAVSCPEKDNRTVKCGKQVQEPIEDGWVGILRSCYTLGDMRINETNGCHKTVVENTTMTFCFCDTSYCNTAPPSVTWDLAAKMAVSFTLSAFSLRRMLVWL